MSRKLYVLLSLVLAIAFALSACGAPAATEAPAATAAPAAAIVVEGQWGRPSPMVATAGAIYMTIKNSGADADKLVSGASAACGAVELHESYKMDNGAMGMRPVTGGFIEIPVGGMAELKPGGLHIMCIDKLTQFVAGAKIPLTLKFEKAGEIAIEVEIREQ